MKEAECAACGQAFTIEHEPRSTARCPRCGYVGEVNEVMTDDDTMMWHVDVDDVAGE